MRSSLNIPPFSGSFVVPRELLQNDSASLLDLHDWNGKHNSQHPLFRFQDGSECKTILWGEAVSATHRAAHFFKALTDPSTEGPIVVAVLASTDFITYFCSTIGLLRAELTVFPISTRNSAEAVRHLLTVTQARYLVINKEAMIVSLAETALKDGPPVTLSYMPSFEDLFPSTQDEVALYPRGSRDTEALAMILHSSGSTAFPKPIHRKSFRLMEYALAPWYGDLNLTGVTMACHILPMFHGMGVMLLATTASCGHVISTYKPSSPAIVPSPESFFEGAVATDSDMVFSVPSIIETWSTDLEKISYLKSLKALIFGGGPLSKKVGDMLVSHGAPLYVEYGHTESGVVSVFLPAPMGADWEYMDFSDQFGPQFIPLGDGTYELALVAHDGWTPLVANSKVDGKDAFSTNDLFIPHETKPGLWKIYGRTDDQIMLSTGEKTNPGPLETMMLQDLHVQSAIMFGRGRPQNGILVDPKKEFQFDVGDVKALEAFKNRIWPTIERMNAFAPQHSRIFKEMIIVSSPTKPFSYTDKGTPRRHAMVREYEQEIENLYSGQALETLTLEVAPPTNWDESSSLDFVRAVVTAVLRRHVQDDADIFRFGCDSLQATWIRNQLLLALRSTVGDRTEYLPQNCVYRAPTIAQLAALTQSAAAAVRNDHGSSVVPHIQHLRDLVAQYTASFPPRYTALRPHQSGLDVVLVTGTTGGLGAHTLFHLLQDATVGQVYALNRVSASLKQQRGTFERYGLDASLLDSSKLRFLTGDLSQPSFELEQSVYEELQSAVTHILHIAWKVDFNQSLSSYEPLLAGVRGLVDFCLSSPHSQTPRLLFTSSMGIFQKLPERVPVPEEPINDPEICVGVGYSESKWIAEQILQAAREKVGLNTTVVRLGQISGGYNGYWNEREWFPAVVKSAIHVGCLPALEGDARIAWVPAYETGEVLVQLRNSHEPILHLAHPSPVPWSTVIQPLASELGVELVSYPTWIAALEKHLSTGDASAVDKMRNNPALRLLDHFRSVDLGPDREPLGGVRMEVVKTLREAPDFAMPAITAESARRWLSVWRAAGFIS